MKSKKKLLLWKRGNHESESFSKQILFESGFLSFSSVDSRENAFTVHSQIEHSFSSETILDHFLYESKHLHLITASGPSLFQCHGHLVDLTQRTSFHHFILSKL